jgi:FkbM family methyltransferase
MLIPFKELFEKYNIKPSGILHLGANQGQEAEAYEELKIPAVIWIEAIPSVYEQLVQNVSKYKNHLCINACVSDVNDQEVEFNVSNNEAQSSSFLELGFHKQAHPEVHYVDKIKMTTKRVDFLVGFGGNWLLNADLQGAELLAFKGLGDLINSIKWIYTEVNSKLTYEGCPLVEELDEYLGTFGFTRVETAEWCGDCWTDALYIKK